MKKAFLIIFVFCFSISRAQTIDSIYVNLYTDSLKKGTYNYISIDGLLSNGRYLPLDSNQISFTSSAGKFFGNNLWLDPDFRDEKVNIRVKLKSNPLLHKEFDIFIKKKPDNEKLKTVEDLKRN